MDELDKYMEQIDYRNNRSFEEKIEATLAAASRAVFGLYSPCEKNDDMCTCGAIYCLDADVVVAQVEEKLYDHWPAINNSGEPIIENIEYPNMSKEQQAAQMAYFAELDPEFIMKLIYSYKLLHEYAKE